VTGSTHDEYAENATQYDAVCLPEAWNFMKDRWQAVRQDRSPWPIVVVIDDGFYPSDDSTIRPEIRPGYPDGSGRLPRGTAWGDTPPSGMMSRYGHHGTAVLSLLASQANNGFLISGVAGPWSNISNGSKWGADFLPVRIGDGSVLPQDVMQLVKVFSEVVFSLNQIRVVNISKDLADLQEPDGSDLEARLRWAEARQVIVVTGSGNDRSSIESSKWVRHFDNVAVVGALNENGTDLWIDNSTQGTATGPGVDLYAPGKNLIVIGGDRSTVPPGPVSAPGSGTSFATPIVTGVATMMLNIDPSLDAWMIRDILAKSADRITPASGGPEIGRLNAYRAVLCTSTVVWSNTPLSNGRLQSWSCTMGNLGSASGNRMIPFVRRP
jgi:serine protease